MDSKRAIELFARICDGQNYYSISFDTGIEIAALIERQERMLDKMLEAIAESTMCCHQDDTCPENYVSSGCRGCWSEWFEKECAK